MNQSPLLAKVPIPRLLVIDRKPKQRATSRAAAPKTARAERVYAQQLERVGAHVGELIGGFTAADLSMVPALQSLLERYAQALTPWAERTAGRMLAEVNARDIDTWRALGRAISGQLRRDLTTAPVGGVMKRLLGEQVTLIRSLPLEAAKRVHELTLKGLESSTRAREVAQEIARSGDVTQSRATLIARTEVARTASVLTQTRAQYVGSTHYVWRTSRDGAVRPGHRDMEGKACEWAHPPAVNESGRVMHFHPGQIWNCRCWPEPILIDDEE